MNNKNQITIIISVVLIMILITIGITYAYFTANLTGTEDSTTITVTGGSMNIYYSGGANINISNIIPDDNPAAIKTFTVTGNNTTDIEMQYQINLVVEKNTFSNEALNYKLISTNTDNNGEVSPSVNGLTNIDTGTSTINLGVGYFDVPTDGDKVHTYHLEIYFPNQDYNQNIDQEKEIKAHIEIINYEPGLKDLIIAQGGGEAAIVSRGTPDFNTIEGTGIYAADDEYGTSYYYRGDKELLNNNLIWAGFQWKIVRINGDGSIRLIYNGTEEQFNINGIMNDTGPNALFNGDRWISTYDNDAKYVGYMYGGAKGAASTIRNGLFSIAATYNETSSDVKLSLDDWYQQNIVVKGYSGLVADNLFCNDRQLQSEVGGSPTGPGYGESNETIYATYHRLWYAKSPTLKCKLKNDRFTVHNISIGNGSLTYPIALLTADEASMAGAVSDQTNIRNYLYTSHSTYLLSPYKLITEPFSYATITTLDRDATLSNQDVTGWSYTRPVLSVDKSVVATGTGTATDPFRI